MRNAQRYRNHNERSHADRLQHDLRPEDVIATVQNPWARWGDVPGGDLLASQLILEPQDRELAELFNLVRSDQLSKGAVCSDPFWPQYPASHALPELSPGRIPIAALPTGDVLSLGIEDILKNILICGPTGGGKTNSIKAIIAAILESSP